MRNRWSLILPVVGLLLFAGVSLESLYSRHAYQKAPGRYFYWSSIRLNVDPLDRRPHATTPCKDAEGDCVGWDPVSVWVDPGLLAKSLMLSALPVFGVGMLVVRGLGRTGVSEVLSFMVSMPLLICAWYYAVGRLIDRWLYKRRQNS
jgi:hypothetical protein